MDIYRFPEIKKRSYTRPCRIAAVHAGLPQTAVTNAELLAANGLHVTDRAVRKTIGVAERRVAARGTADTDLMAEAANGCLQKAGMNAADLSRIIVNKFIGDKLLPMTASLLQARLDCPAAVQAFDIDGGVNGFFQALELAAALIESGDEHILIVSGGIIHPLVRQTDARHAFLFGDAAAAVLVSRSEEVHVLSAYSFSNHRFAGLSTGFVFPDMIPGDIHITGNYAVLYDLYRMENWEPALPFIREAAAHTTACLLEAAGLKKEQIDLLLVTEYNSRIAKEITAASDIPEEKALSCLARFGNTLSAMLPLLLCKAEAEKRLEPGTTALLLSIGEGISGGGMLYRF